MDGRKVKHETINQSNPITTDDGKMIKKPTDKHRKRELTITQSIPVILHLLSRETTTNISSGPQAIYSPHIAAGDTTL
jgi:hypothetical protein